MRLKEEIENKKEKLMDELFSETEFQPFEVFSIVNEIKLLNWILEPRKRMKKDPSIGNSKLNEFGKNE